MKRGDELLVRLTLIGSVEAVDSSGTNVLPPSRKARALLAYLALNAGQWIPRVRITRMLWDRVPKEQGRASLRQALHELSRSMGPVFSSVVEAERERLRLQSGSVWVDALGLATSEDPSNDPSGLNVFSGSLLLDGFDNLSDEFDHWLVAERQKLEERMRRWSESRIQESPHDPNEPQQRVESARRAVATDPTNEDAVRELMQALAASGQRAQAVVEYERCRAVLRSRLDLEPAPETQRLYRDLRRERLAEAAKPEPPRATAEPAQPLAQQPEDRAILVVDVVDSARLVARDDLGTVTRWLSFVEHVKGEVLLGLRGRLIKSLGDGMLLEFADTRSAARAAFAMQAISGQQNDARPPSEHIRLRMGIEVGEVVVGDTDVYDHCVNLAARLTTLAGPGEIVITANARDRLVPVLDADVEDLGECHLKNIDAPVRAYRIAPPGARPLPFPRALHARLLPSIAVIPFVARMSPAEHDVLGEVLADELIGALSRSLRIDVISRLSTTVFRSRAASIADIGKHLNTNYVLSGAYRTHGQDIALELELSEVRSERIIWSERFADKISALFRGEQELVVRIMTDVYSAMISQELRRARSTPLPTLESYTLLMSAISMMHRMSLRDFMTAREMLQAIIDRSPRQATPLAWLAKWYVLRIQQGWTDSIERDRADATRCASQALDEDPDSSLALAVDGLVHTHMTKKHDLAKDRYALAVRSNPNDALAWLLKGTQHALVGEGAQGVQDTERALRLSPLDPHGYYFHSLAATAHITAEQNDLALEHAEHSLRANRSHTSTLRVKAVAQWRLGLEAEARQTAADLLLLEPNLTVSGWLKRSPSAPYPNGRAFAETLAKIGIPN